LDHSSASELPWTDAGFNNTENMQRPTAIPASAPDQVNGLAKNGATMNSAATREKKLHSSLFDWFRFDQLSMFAFELWLYIVMARSDAGSLLCCLTLEVSCRLQLAAVGQLD